MSAAFRDDVDRKGTAEILPPHVIALIRERQRRLAAIPRYDRYIAQAAGRLTLQGFWRNLKRQDQEDIQWLNLWLDEETADVARAMKYRRGGSDRHP
jgi:hypothetical protein